VTDWQDDYRPIDRSTEEETLRQWRRTGSVLEDKKDKRKTIAWILATLIVASGLTALIWL
jgi:hypothetical protein